MLFDDYHIPSKVITSGDKRVLEVRGLSFADVSELVHNHRADLDTIIKLWGTFDGEDVPEGDITEMMGQFAIEVLHTAPAIVASVISICADCPEQKDRIARLPISILISSIEAIIHLTSDDFGGIMPMAKKIGGMVMANAPKALNAQLQKAQQAKNG